MAQADEDPPDLITPEPAEAPAPAPEPGGLDQALDAIARLKAELDEFRSRPLEPGPGNSRGQLSRDVGEQPLEIRRSTLADRSADTLLDRVRLQQELSDAFRTGRKVRFVRDTPASLEGGRVPVRDGPQYVVKKIEHRAAHGLPGWIEFIATLAGRRPGKGEP
jgi:hypothetical protein